MNQIAKIPGQNGLETAPTIVEIHNGNDHHGVFKLLADEQVSSIWTRLNIAAHELSITYSVKENLMVMPWIDAFSVTRELGSRETQARLNFLFRPCGVAKQKLADFSKDVKRTGAPRMNPIQTWSCDEINEKLKESGFSKRELKAFQMRALSKLLSLSNGANFSVPGSVKTTVAFALHVLIRSPSTQLMVFSPKYAFQTWSDIIDECMIDTAPNNGAEKFTILNGTGEEIKRTLESGASRFLILYNLAVCQLDMLSDHISNNSVHVIHDESHYVIANKGLQQYSELGRISANALRRDVLSGSPMPCDISNLGVQFDFIWPGHGLGRKVTKNKSQKEVFGNLYVRTTQDELGIPQMETETVDVEMDTGQLAFYSIVKNSFLHSFEQLETNEAAKSEIMDSCRKKLLQLMQISVNPTLALGSITEMDIDSEIVEQIYLEGRSAKMQSVMQKVYEIAKTGEKSVVWTVFSDSIPCLANSLADLSPSVMYGKTRTLFAKHPENREDLINRFQNDRNCKVLIANPATEGGDMNLHKVCHNSIYLDRSYVPEHYLQSKDLINRLGMPINQKTKSYIFNSIALPEIGSIDKAIGRSLAWKMSKLEKTTVDSGLREFALSDEICTQIVNYGIEETDFRDLTIELKAKNPMTVNNSVKPVFTLICFAAFQMHGI